MAVIPIGISLVILPLCGGGGLVMLPPLILWLAGYLYWGWWSGRGLGRWARSFGVSSLMACSAIVALYLVDFNFRVSPLGPLTPGHREHDPGSSQPVSMANPLLVTGRLPR